MFFCLSTTQGEKVIPQQSELGIFMMTSLEYNYQKFVFL